MNANVTPSLFCHFTKIYDVTVNCYATTIQSRIPNRFPFVGTDIYFRYWRCFWPRSMRAEAPSSRVRNLCHDSTCRTRPCHYFRTPIGRRPAQNSPSFPSRDTRRRRLLPAWTDTVYVRVRLPDVEHSAVATHSVSLCVHTAGTQVGAVQSEISVAGHPFFPPLVAG